jgi:hypothetical protein
MVQVICNPSRNTISFGSLPILQFNIFFILLTEEEKGKSSEKMPAGCYSKILERGRPLWIFC